jgi:hypothetical protein
LLAKDFILKATRALKKNILHRGIDIVLKLSTKIDEKKECAAINAALAMDKDILSRRIC